MKTDPNSPAYPFACQGPATAPEIYYGLTKRETMAMRFMAALIGLESTWEATSYKQAPAEIAVAAANLTDALIAELNKEPEAKEVEK